MTSRRARTIRNLLDLPLPRAMKPGERMAYRTAKRAYDRLSSVAKTLYNANARALSLTVLPSNP